jgi:hypothetical protein
MTDNVAVVTKNAYSPGMESHSKRRAIASKIITQLQHLQSNEETCMDNIPENFWESGAFTNAEHAAEYLQEAIEMLQVAYCLEF